MEVNCSRRGLFAVIVSGTVALLALPGCGTGRITTYPVRGKVSVDGAPAAGARIIFHPQNGSEAFQKERPLATVGEQGDFQITTFDKGDGAPAGDYIVTVKWRTSVPQPALAEGEEEDEERSRRMVSKDRLGGKYGKPQTSTLKVTIVEGENELEPFVLTTR